MKNDYLFVYRRIKRSPDFRDAFDRLIFEDLLLSAAWEDREVKIGGLKVIEAVGSVYISRKTVRRHLGNWCSLAPMTILRRLAHLEKTGCVKLTPSISGTLVEFPRWAEYQITPNGVSTPQPAKNQDDGRENGGGASRAAREQGTEQGEHPCSRPENEQPTEAAGEGIEGEFYPAREQGTDQGSGPCSKSESVQRSLRQGKTNTTELIPNGLSVTKRAREEQKPGQTDRPEEEEEVVRQVCRQIEEEAERTGHHGLNMRKEWQRTLVRAALRGEYPCPRLEGWPDRPAYSPNQILNAVRWFYAEPHRRNEADPHRRVYLHRIGFALGVNRRTGEDALAEMLGKIELANSPGGGRKRGFVTTRELELEEDLEKAEIELEQRKTTLKGQVDLPAEDHARSLVLRELLFNDEKWSRLDLRRTEVEVKLGRKNEEDLVEARAFFADRFDHDPEVGA